MVKKTSKVKKPKESESNNPLYEQKVKNYTIGCDIQPKRDLYRFVRWPENIQIQRKKRILLKRLKVPPVVNQFNETLDRNQTKKLFKLLLKYRPESKEEKKERLVKVAQEKEEKKEQQQQKPYIVKYGLKHVTNLIENKSARLVVIANDVEPLEVVVWLPTLCRTMDIPFLIVKNKARLGTLLYKKTASVLALTDVKKEDSNEFEGWQKTARSQFNEAKKTWGGKVMGCKHQHKMAARERALAAEAAKKAGL